MPRELRITFSVNIVGDLMPTLADIYKYYRPAVRDTAKDIRNTYNKEILSHFTRPNRAKIITRSGQGRSPIDGRPGTIWSAVGTDNERTPLVWLEGGTKVRWRHVSRDWRSKTYKNSGLRFRVGRGRATGWGRNPGIEARNFRNAIVKKHEPTFVDRVNAGTDRLWRERLRRR